MIIRGRLCIYADECRRQCENGNEQAEKPESEVIMERPNWFDVEAEKDDSMIIDIGYVTDESARNRAEKLFAFGISKKNLVWGPSTGDMRIHIFIPKARREKVLAAFPIQDKKTWFGATHSWTGGKA